MKLKNSPHFSLTSFPTILVTLISFILVTAVFLTMHAYAASDTTPTSGTRLITIHDADTTQGVMTKGATLRQVFKDASIPITDQDLVEPGLDAKLTANDYEVNVYRARPITIVDGHVHKRVMSPYRTADQIVKHAGMTLHDEDQTTVTPNRDVIASGPGLTLTIDRATPFSFIINGQKVKAYTQGSTVRDMLTEKGVSVDKTLSVSVSLQRRITAGMIVSIWRDGKHTTTEREAVKFSVKQVRDADKPTGYKKVTTPGRNGQKIVTYKLSIKDGKVIHKKSIQSVVTKKPVQQIETIGTKQNALPPGSHSDWMRQAGISSGDFGYVNYIFNHESGWNPGAVNAAGYYGLGQTSRSNLVGACGSGFASDPVCQIKFFNSYKSRYGSWKAAYEFKASRGWW